LCHDLKFEAASEKRHDDDDGRGDDAYERSLPDSRKWRITFISNDSVCVLALAGKMIVDMSRRAEINMMPKMLTSIGAISGRMMEKKVRIEPPPQTREECSSSIPIW
jgi:hypothetical protein